MNCQEIGLIGLCMGRKSTFALIVLAVSSVALFTRHLDSTTFGVVVSVICTSLFAAHSYQQCNLAKPLPPDPPTV